MVGTAQQTPAAARPPTGEDLDVDSLVAGIVDELRAGFGGRLLAVALYGSRARGTARLHSDVDLLVVARDLPRAWDRGGTVRAAVPRLPLEPPVGFLLRTPEEFDRDVTPLHLDVALDARVLYEQAGWLSTRLDRLRELLKQARLGRGPDLFWRWEQPPARPDWSITWEGVAR